MYITKDFLIIGRLTFNWQHIVMVVCNEESKTLDIYTIKETFKMQLPEYAKVYNEIISFLTQKG